MKTEEFDYNLPKELIAQAPANPRDSSRLLILNKENGVIQHKIFSDFLDYLKSGDVLVMNNSRVFPARLIGRKEITGGNAEIFLNHEVESGLWECLGKNLKVGNRIKFTKSKLSAVVVEKNNDTYQIRFNQSGGYFFNEIEKIGLTPLPPYIKRKLQTKNYKLKTSSDRSSYQTVYAKERGSVAAPTAGLHFTPELLVKIKNKGVDIEYLTLHVGLGTFAPVKSETIEKHKIHKEFFSIDKSTISKIVKAKKANRQIIAVGTTTVRTLEHIYKEWYAHRSLPQINTDISMKSEKLTSYPSRMARAEADNLNPKTYLGWTDIFIYPGYKFKCVDSMVTNFHLPKSSLLMLVSAFAGKENINQAYLEGIKAKYRFYSYGDAMLIV